MTSVLDFRRKLCGFFRYESMSGNLSATHLTESSELVATSPTQRNWRGIGIALLVIIVVCALIVTAVVVLTPADTGPRVKGEEFTLDDFLGNNFTAQTFNGTWISDDEFIYQKSSLELYTYNVATNSSSLLVSSFPFNKFMAQQWWLSADRKYLLIATGITKIFRYSFVAKYIVYNINTEQGEDLVVDQQNPELQYAQWSPANNSLVFVYKNNVYFKPLAEGGLIKQLTFNTPEEFIFNGIPDWVYEEEIIGSNHALWFSPDGRMLCYASFNDSVVPQLVFEWYGPIKEPRWIYPQPQAIRYPKPNFTNPTVWLTVVDVTSITNDSDVVQSDIVKEPEILEQDHYFTAVRWISNSEISVVWMNRTQNKAYITICKSNLWNCNESYQEDSTGRGWVDIYDPPIFNKAGDKYFFRGAALDGTAGYFRQVFAKNVSSGMVDVLTHGKWEVTKIKAYDEQNKVVFYIAAPESKPGERHLYWVPDTSSPTGNKTGTCMSCDIGPECLYVDATFSTDNAYYVLDCLGPSVPKVLIYETSTNKQINVWEGNSGLLELISTKALPQMQTFRVSLQDGYVAQVKLLLPPVLRDFEITKYPMIVDVYGGPASQQVSEKYGISWGTYLSSGEDIIYAFIDGRGSGFQGEKRMHELYRRLGTVEVEDQIAVAKFLVDTLSYIDKDRVAIWGWSYGGFVTAMVMGKDVTTKSSKDASTCTTTPGVFKCGMSVAPVTNWRYYDSVYTERYMGMPSYNDNEAGYMAADTLQLASNFCSKQYYLIHGTADDNVHFQQSMMLSRALEEAEVVFRAQVYPDENHSLHGTKKHLYLSLGDFLKTCFRTEGTAAIGLQMTETDGEKDTNDDV